VCACGVCMCVECVCGVCMSVCVGKREEGGREHISVMYNTSVLA